MAGTTTIYDVITRYSVQDGNASAKVAGLAANATKATTGMVGLRSAVTNLAGPLRMLGMAMGVTSVGAAGIFALSKSFSGLNEQVVRTNQLAAALSNFFRFSTDPAENFSRAMAKARQMTNELIRDAARLPGESRDFFQIMSLLAGPTFAGGGGTGTLRKLTANVALAAPFVMQNPADAANQANRMLLGTAGTGDNPLFAGLTAMGFLPKADIFNRLPAADRLMMLNTALEKLAGNPFFRAEIAKQFDVQIGTLMDVLFGPQGIGGQLARPAFEALGEGLMSLNKILTENVPTIVGSFRLLGSGISGLFSTVTAIPAWLGSHIAKQFGVSGELDLGQKFYAMSEAEAGLSKLVGPDNLRLWKEDEQRGLLKTYLQSMYEESILKPGTIQGSTITEAVRATAGKLGGRKILGINTPYDDITGVSANYVLNLLRENLFEMTKEGGDPKRLNPLAGNQVYNTIHIKVDLKSDDSPEAVALKVGEGLKRLSRRRTQNARAVQLSVDPRSQ